MSVELSKFCSTIYLIVESILGTIVLFLIFLLRCIINWLCILVKNGYKKEELKVNLGKVHPTNLINHDPFTTGKYNIEQSWEFMLNKLE